MLALGPDELWATNNGRDWLGDDQPPETVCRVEEGEDVGTPEIEIQAHLAPLGLTFYTGLQFPQEYWGDLFVAFHGSWNRAVLTGYKVVRIPMQDGTPGAVEDFAGSWLREDGSHWGRPADLLTEPRAACMRRMMNRGASIVPTTMGRSMQRARIR
jgi:glucose/arabinose dehydrogenase